MVMRRNSEDGETCHPGEVTLRNIVDKIIVHKKLELDASRLELHGDVEFPIKVLGTYPATYTHEINGEFHAIDFTIEVNKR